jgi:acylphosphatase
MSKDERIVRLLVTGRVQGVGFRAFVEDAALSRGLRGWVRNRRDGGVEAVIAGPRESVRDAIDAVRAGPPASVVDRVDVQEAEAPALEAVLPGVGFSILRTE